MAGRQPEAIPLLVGLLGTLAIVLVLAVDLTLAHRRAIEAGAQRLQQFSAMMTEHTARSLEAVDVLVREIATDLSLSRPDWPTWSDTRGWEYIAQRHSQAMPQLRDLIVVDQRGEQRFVSKHFPPPAINLRDRPYFQTLAGGARSIADGPYIGRISNRYSYVIAHRLSRRNQEFAGIVMATLEPAYTQEFCWSNRLGDDFDAMLVNLQGIIVASCRPSDLSPQSAIIGQPLARVLGAGLAAPPLEEAGVAELADRLISVAPIAGFGDLRLVAVLPRGSVLTAWRERLIEFTALGLVLALLLISGALLLRRQFRELARATRDLASHRDQLEERVRLTTAELAREKDTAELANTAKSRFLAAASHDLRQPLHALALFSADLRRKADRQQIDELPDLADKIAASTATLGKMLDALLDISRLDIQGIQPDPQVFALQSLFDRLEASFWRAAADRRQTLRFHSSRRWINTDPILLERMLGNLISNALRYTPIGGRILVGCRRQGDSIRLEVRDNGQGIAREHRAAIFAEFYQVANTAREREGGLGLGLSIVDRLARALGMEIRLESAPGRGTCFALLLAPDCTHREVPLRRSAGHVHFIGQSAEIAECRQLIEHWQYETSDGPPGSASQQPPDTIILCDPTQVPQVGRNTVLIVLNPGENTPLPPAAHALNLPVRPARLRALLRANPRQAR